MKSRKRKQQHRATIRWAKGKIWKSIHDIWDDYYYWIARQAWEEIHKGKIYDTKKSNNYDLEDRSNKD